MQTDIYENEIQQALLGNGSLGEVMRVIQNGKVYALKRIDKLKINKLGRRAQLDREIEIMKKIHHQNIVQFISFEQKEKFFQIKMEYCAGQDLRKFLLSQKYKNQILPTMAKQFAVRVCLDIIYAYTQLRSHLVVNRDIKLDNIMIDVSNGKDKQKITTKMIDFGEAKFSIQQIRTRTGTRGYMAPQIYFGADIYSQACDQWSLGLTFYEIFQGVNIQNLSQKLLKCPFKQNFYPKNENDYFIYYNKLIYESINLTISRTPAPFRYIIRQLLRVDPNQRINLSNLLSTLVTRFDQFQDCFSSKQEAESQLQKLQIYLSKNKQTDKKKQQIDIYIKKTKQLYRQLFLPLNKNVPQKQYKNYVEVIKVILLIINKIGQLITFAQSGMEINTDYAIKQVFNFVIPEDQFNQMESFFQKYYLFLARNKIVPLRAYNGAGFQVQQFIEKNIGNKQKILDLMSQLLDE